jgi:hypothetical protein
MRFVLPLLFVGVTLLPAQSPAPVKKVRTIYVTELHTYSGADNLDYDSFLRSKLISSLVERCGSNCTVLEENPDKGADAVLSGSILLQSADRFHRRAQGAMRLVDRDGAVIWASTVYSNPYAKSPTSSLADRTAKKLVDFLSGKAESEN